MARKVAPKRQTHSERNVAQDSGCTALYVRVSTDKQASEGYSLDAQLQRLTAYCAAHGWTVCSEHVYTDAGQTGTNTDREALQRMLAAAQAGAIRRIVAIKLDRLARNVRDFLGLVDSLSSWGCDLALIAENFDTSTPTGKFALTLFAAMAELEAGTITERVMTGKRQKAQEGGFNGSPAPLGYTLVDGTFVPNEDAGTVESIFDWFVGGDSLTEIAKRLAETKAPTARGGAWRPVTVRYILSNGVYAGIAQWDGAEMPEQYPAIVGGDIYEAAQRRLADLRPGRPKAIVPAAGMVY